MEVTHIFSSAYSNSKEDLFGEVLKTVPKIQNKLGHNTSVIMPLYHEESVLDRSLINVFNGTVVLDRLKFPFSIYQEFSRDLSFDIFLVSIPGLFDCDKIYSYNDDTEKFLAFQFAILDWFLSKEIIPGIIHCHDHQSFLIPFLITQAYKYEKLKNISTTILINDSMSQGEFCYDKIRYLPEFNLEAIELLEFEKGINSMASAMRCSSMVVSVSHDYIIEPKNSNFLVRPLLRSVEKKYPKNLNPKATQFLVSKSGVINQGLKNSRYKKKARITTGYRVQPAELVRYYF
jgi:starch synthase